MDNIMMRGEMGDGSDLQPLKFLLHCPSCKASKECAHVRLFSKVARGIACSTCRKNTTSTRWNCSHGTPWTDCHVCRHVGFRCGSQSLRKHSSQSNRVMHATTLLNAHRRKQAKRRALGSLGDPKGFHPLRSNSVGQSPHHRAIVHKKIIKRRGERPPPKREMRSGRLDAQQTPNTKDRCSSDHHAYRDYHTHATSSVYWQAHCKRGVPDGVPTSNNVIHAPKHHLGSAGSALGEPHNQAKKARVCVPFSTPVKGCKGNCPTVWTIESFCERCHG